MELLIRASLYRTIMASKLVIALALSPAAALQLPGVGEVALKLPHRSSVLRDAISHLAAAQAHLEAVFRPPPPRAATHSISDIEKEEIQEGRARTLRRRSREQKSQQHYVKSHTPARAVAAPHPNLLRAGPRPRCRRPRT